MYVNRIELAGILAALTVAILAVVFFTTQGVALAQESGENITNDVYGRLCENGMIFFSGCVSPDPSPSDPCDLPGMASNPDCVDDTDPTPDPNPCTIFDELGNLPPNCDSGGNGGGGGGTGTTDACPNEAKDPGIQTSGPCNADDVCPDLAGVQTNASECQTSGGGGGTGIGTDNGGVSGSGGGGGGGGGGYLTLATTTATSTPAVLGMATSTSASCDMYLTAFLRFGKSDNDMEQVKRLQHVLLQEGSVLEENGVFDEATLKAVHAFQLKYASEILAPWSLKTSTGFVYLTTRKKVNEIYCKETAQFPLTEEEVAVIEKAKVVAPLAVAPAKRPVSQRASIKEIAPVKTIESAVPLKVENADEDTVTRGWNVGGFLRRLFNRGE